MKSGMPEELLHTKREMTGDSYTQSQRGHRKCNAQSQRLLNMKSQMPWGSVTHKFRDTWGCVHTKSVTPVGGLCTMSEMTG